jgi:ribosomal-protein-alanine N-acetyltransferase
MDHPTGTAPVRLFGRRVMLRPLIASDFAAFGEVRTRNGRWLTDWEPLRPMASADPAVSHEAFERRCLLRERERIAGNAYSFGMFVDSIFCGEVNLNGVTRGSMQSATIGYWIAQSAAGQNITPTAVALAIDYLMDDLGLHRVEIDIRPENAASLRVVEKLGLRLEGIKERFIHIEGGWRDHKVFAITAD